MMSLAPKKTDLLFKSGQTANYYGPKPKTYRYAKHRGGIMTEHQSKKMDPLFLFLSVGSGVGMGLGFVFNSPFFGLAIGTAVGVAIGMVFRGRSTG